MTDRKPIDPRGPRFGAAITAILLLVVVGLGLSGNETAGGILLAAIVALFGWAAFAGIERHPYGALFRRFVRPKLGAPSELESPVPPTFAQGVGFVITLAGLALHLVGVDGALVVAASAAFIAAFLNSVFGYCLGCQIYVLLVRAGILGRKGAATP